MMACETTVESHFLKPARKQKLAREIRSSRNQGVEKSGFQCTDTGTYNGEVKAQSSG